MDASHNHPWWAFDIDRTASVVPGDTMSEEMRDRLQRGRTSYVGYVALDQLLAAQVPCTSVPDERAFLIAHQLIELTFKLMIFDAAVIARTLASASAIAAADELHACLDDEQFWRPSTTASARLLLSARTVLPAALGYIGSGLATRKATFDRDAYLTFRDMLGSASGIQSAQFRLIQRALGKSPLLAVRLFPGPPSGQDREAPARVAVTDRSVLEADTNVASPADGSPAATVATLDDAVHRMLLSCARLDDRPVSAGQSCRLQF